MGGGGGGVGVGVGAGGGGGRIEDVQRLGSGFGLGAQHAGGADGRHKCLQVDFKCRPVCTEVSTV